MTSATAPSQNDATNGITELGWEDIGSDFDSENSQVYFYQLACISLDTMLLVS